MPQPKGDLVTVVDFYLLPGESRMELGKQVKETCSPETIHELAEQIRALDAVIGETTA